MYSDALKILALQAALIIGLVAAGLAARVPAPLLTVLSFVAGVLAAVPMLSLKRPEPARTWGLPVAWAGTLAGMMGIVEAAYFWSNLFVIPPFLLGASAWLVSRQYSDETTRNRWRGLAMTWALCGGLIWLAASYADNERVTFYASLPVNVALLILCKKWFRPPALAVQAVNTVILLLVGLPLASVLIYGTVTLRGPIDPAKKYFSYETWARNPTKYVAWSDYFWSQWKAVAKVILTRDHLARGLPYRLAPNSHATLVQSAISINRLGFRGTNIPAEKGRTYRIVAIGESTTFGFTCSATDRPWPELLEAMIRDRLKLSRPVELINAGVPGYDIRHSLIRLPLEILPLKPDMIIAYHGANGFRFIDSALPDQFAPPTPDLRPRPVELLAMAEYKARTMLYNRRYAAGLPVISALATNLMSSQYAWYYRQLIQLARTNGVQLVLANYSMAVNRQSDPKVIEFYAKTGPRVLWNIRANEAHSTIVAGLVQENPDVAFVDTHPTLDGKDDKFIDVVHFTEEGEHLMAEAMFSGIRKILERDLSPATTAGRP